MSASQKLSRGFHRLALFLAAIPLLVGGYFSVFSALLEPSYAGHRLFPLSIGFAITLAVTLAVYGVVRAIGWVVGGFAAS